LAKLLKEGAKAPLPELPDETGTKLSLKSLVKKKPLILYFYPRDLTPGCTIEACDFRDNMSRLKKKANVVGVSFDTSEKHGKFIGKHRLNFPLIADVDKSLGKAYGVFQKKKFMGREFMGIVRSTFLIDKTGKIKKVWSPVKVKGHVDEVLASL